MRKIVVSEFVSLDNVMQAPGGAEEETSCAAGAPLRMKTSILGVANFQREDDQRYTV